jgi:glycosyltransferase involved in cell wall biosynthesis
MISVVMPSHNEEAYLEMAVAATVAGMRDRELSFEVIINENGSSDRTLDEARRMEALYTEVQVLTSPTADYGLALRDGFLVARGEVVVNFDVDLVDLDFVDRALPLIDGGVHVVVGSKRAPGAEDQRGSARKLVTAVFSGILKHGFGLGISDTHGLKAMSRAPVLELVERCRYTGDIFDTELVLRSQRAGLRVAEIPVTVAERRPPRTAIARRIPRSLLGLVRLRVSFWRGR